MSFGLVKVGDGPSELVAGFDIPRAAAAACVSESHIRSEIRKGNLRAKKRGRRVIILPEDLAAYIREAPDWTPGEAPEAANAARRKS
jgi:hypothetical protein